MRKRKINQELMDLLGSGRWNDFTVSELKAAYMALPSCPHRTEKAAWQFVYRNVARMESRGLIRRLGSEEGAKTRYQWAVAEVKNSVPTDTRFAADDATLSCLKEKLHRYKVEMLTAISDG